MSTSMVTSVLVIATLVASPALAQRQRNPGGGGGGWQGGETQAQERGGRSSPVPQGGGSRGDAQARGGRPGGGYDEPRQYAAPAPRYRQPQQQAPSQQAQSRAGVDTGRYAVPRDQASGGRYGGPTYRGPNYGARQDPRAYQSPGFANRGYSGRYVDPGYNRGYYGSGRSYAVPRYTPRTYAYGGYRGYAYTTPRYYAPRGYVSPYWRGAWRGGWGGAALVTPRFIYPNVIGYGAWQPYVYRPSLGLGIYYGANGLYPFGTIPPVFYDPAPGIAYGGLRIVDAPRDAQVFADGYYVGIVDDFDGVFQHLNLEPGPHRVEIHHPGFAPVAFDVDIQPGRTITLRADVY